MTRKQKPKRSRPQNGSRSGRPQNGSGPRASGLADEQMGARIKVRRTELNMSQDDLGKALGVSFQQVQKYEKGTNRISSRRLGILASTLEVPLNFFYGSKGDGREDEDKVNSLITKDPKFSLRLLKAYDAIDDINVKRDFVSLLEHIAGVG